MVRGVADTVFLANMCGVAALVIGGVLNSGSAVWVFAALPGFVDNERQLVMAMILVGRGAA